MKRLLPPKALLLNFCGVGIVLFWLLLIATLVKKVEFGEESYASGPQEHPQVTIDSPRREWREIYLKGKKVGYAVMLVKPINEGFFIQEELFLRLNLMGVANGVETFIQSRTDEQFRLRSFRFRMRSGVVTFNASGQIEDGDLVVTTGDDTEKRAKRIPLAGNIPLMGAGLGYFFESKELNIGETFTLPIFDPSAMAHREATFRVVARESIRVNQATYVAYRLEAELWGQRMSFWLDENGTTLKEEGFLGLTAVKSSAANAPRGLEEGGNADVDLYELAAITPDRLLPKPMRTNYLKVRLAGITESDLRPANLNSTRQIFHDGMIEVTRETLPSRPDDLSPIGPTDEALRPFLQPAFNIESDEKEIISKAREITGEERSPLAICRKL